MNKISDYVAAGALQAMKLGIKITEEGKYHAFVELAGHVSLLTARVVPADTDYQDETREPVLGVFAFMDAPDSGAQVDALLAYLRAYLQARA